MSDQRLMVYLDCLLDTRIATVSKLNPSAAKAMVQEAYWNRLSDDFSELSGGLVKHEEYRDAYKKRDKSTLAVSRATNVCLLLGKIYKLLGEKRVSAPDVDDITLDINYWPYELAPEEVSAIETAVAIYVGPEVKIQSVSIEPINLTPLLVDKNYDAVVLYDYDDWITLHQTSLQNKPIPRTTMLVPATTLGGKLNKEDCVISGVGAIQPFAALEGLMTPLIDLHMLDVGYFSLIKE